MPQEFCQKEFVCGNSPVTRGELEGLPCPFCPAAVTDAQMQAIVKETDAETKLRWRLPTDGPIDLGIMKHGGTNWRKRC